MGLWDAFSVGVGVFTEGWGILVGQNQCQQVHHLLRDYSSPCQIPVLLWRRHLVECFELGCSTVDVHHLHICFS